MYRPYRALFTLSLLSLLSSITSLNITQNDITFSDLHNSHQECEQVCSLICASVNVSDCIVYGSGMYAAPSHVCCAALHDGVFGHEGGRVDFTSVMDQVSFIDEYHNNLRTESYEYEDDELHVGYYFQKELIEYPVFTKEPSDGNLSDDPSVKLSCEAISGSEECTNTMNYTWTRNGQVEERQTKPVYDTDEEGIYRCVVWCEVGGAKSGVMSTLATVAYTKVKGRGDERGDGKSDFIVGYPLEKGTSITLPCSSSLYHNTNKLSSTKVSTPGVFQCEGKYYFVVWSVMVNITGLNTESVSVEKNKGAMVKCLVTGYPLPFMNWLHDGAHINSTYKTSWLSNSALMLNYVVMETTGHYQCFTKSAPGQLSDKITVTVIVDDKITHLNADKDVYITGDTMTITCMYEIEGDKNMVLKWFHNSTTVEDVHDVKSENSKVYTRVVLERGNAKRYEARLEMSNVSMKHAGMYEAELYIDGKDRNKHVISTTIVEKITVKIEGEVFPECDRFDTCNIVERKTKQVKKKYHSNNTYIGKVICVYEGAKSVKHNWLSKSGGSIKGDTNNTGLKYFLFVGEADDYSCKGCNSLQCVQSDWVSIQTSVSVSVRLSLLFYFLLIASFL